MKRLVGTALLIVILPLALACGEAESQSVEQGLVDVFFELNVNSLDTTKYLCACHWSDEQYWSSDTEYSGEQECLDDWDAERDKETIRFCMDRVLDDIRAFEGDRDQLEKLNGCLQDAVDDLQNCLDAVPDICSESNADQRQDCHDDYRENEDACVTLHASENIEAWTEEYLQEATPRCY